MPWFMLIIGVAIPFSVASSIAKGVSTTSDVAAHGSARGDARGAGMDSVLLPRSVRQFALWQIAMDIFVGDGCPSVARGQLSGCENLLRPQAKPRAAIASALFIGHWAILRFYPQGDLPRGTFNEQFEAIGYIYSHWKFWDWITLHLGPVTIGWRGLMSVPPATATMLIGTLIGDRLRHTDLSERQKVSSMVRWGALMAAIGFLWAFDLPFNKPRWTPCYLLWTSGVGTMLIALLYWIIDVKQIRGWTYPLVVFGTNAIALYFCSILAKVLLLNTLHVHGQPVIMILLETLKGALGPWAGGWTFTLGFILFWWVIMDQMYRRRVFWKL